MKELAAPTLLETITVMLSRTLRDNDVGFTGLTTGHAAAMYGTMIPVAAMQLARERHAPNLTILFGGWCINPSLSNMTRLPNAEFDPALLELECDARDMSYPPLYSFRRGDVTVGFSSGAQVDRYGNLNTTQVHAPRRGNLRLVGPILIPEHFGMFGREIIMMPKHDPLRFVERVDHRTGVGFPDGREGRQRDGLHGGGPELIISPLGVFGFDEEGRIVLIVVHPNVTFEDVRTATGFPIDYKPVDWSTPPENEELATLRSAVDPHGHLRMTL